MFKVQIRLNQLFLRIKLPQPKDEKETIFVKIYVKEKAKWVLLQGQVPLVSQLQPLGLSHTLYLRRHQLNERQLFYFLTLTNQPIRNDTKINKYIGEFDIGFQNLNLGEEFPVGFQKQINLKKCPDTQAWLRLGIVFREVIEFRDLLDNQQSKQEQPISEKQILRQQQNQNVIQIKKQISRLLSRQSKLEQQIAHLKQEDSELITQIAQRKQTLKINQRIQEDQIDSLIHKNIMAEEEFKKTKEKIAKVFNLINQYGRPDVVEQTTDLLAQNPS